VLFRLFYVYIMASYSRVLYTGVTSNLGNRVAQHRSDTDPNAFCTRYRIHHLVYFEEYSSVLQAIARETQIKAYRRAKKTALIDAFNPEWKDLAPEDPRDEIERVVRMRHVIRLREK
jgi:putative endonuclease